MSTFDPFHFSRDTPTAPGDDPPDPWSHRPSITVGVRLVDNGAIIYCNARNVGPQFNIPPESVATSVDQAVEKFRDMIQKVWPISKSGGS